jgi:hypothetical protein
MPAAIEPRNGAAASTYRITRTERFDDAYPHVAPLLATACDLEIHR